MTQARTHEKTRLTIVVPNSIWVKIRRVVPRGDYSKFFSRSASRELDRIGREKIADLRGKIEFDLDWEEMEKIELKYA